DAAGRAPDALTADPAVTRRRAQIATHALTVRRAIGRRPAPPPTPEGPPQDQLTPPGPTTPPDRSVPTALTALEAIDTQLTVLSALFGPPPVLTPGTPAAATG
ncbi:hypothetical protein ACWEBX_41020, partial [Streptomyces sp. NPDC005070]